MRHEKHQGIVRNADELAEATRVCDAERAIDAALAALKYRFLDSEARRQMILAYSEGRPCVATRCQGGSTALMCAINAGDATMEAELGPAGRGLSPLAYAASGAFQARMDLADLLPLNIAGARIISDMRRAASAPIMQAAE